MFKSQRDRGGRCHSGWRDTRNSKTLPFSLDPSDVRLSMELDVGPFCKDGELHVYVSQTRLDRPVMCSEMTP
jgi:hypothetical protein